MNQAYAIDERRRIAKPHQNVHAERGIVAIIWIQLGIKAIPEGFDDASHHLESVRQPTQPFRVQQGASQPDSDAQILGLGQEREGAIANLFPVWLLGRHDGIAHLLLGLALGDSIQLEECRIVFEVRTARCIRGNRLKQRLDVLERHISLPS